MSSDTSADEAIDSGAEQPPEPAVPKRRLPVRHGLIALGVLCYVVGWVLPHGHRSSVALVELPVVLAESSAAGDLPPGWALTTAEIDTIGRGVGDLGDIEEPATGPSFDRLTFSADGCGADADCAAQAGERLRAAVADELQQRADTLIERLRARRAGATERVEPGRQAAGSLAALDLAAFTAKIGDGSIHPDGVTTASAQAELAGYQAMVAATGEIEQIDRALAALADPTALIDRTLGAPTVTESERRAGRVAPIVLSTLGAIIALIALVRAPVRFPERRRFLRRGKPAAAGRVVLLLLGLGVAAAVLALGRLATSAATARSSLERLRNDIGQAQWDALSDDLRDVAQLSRRIGAVLDQPVTRVVTGVLPGGAAQRADIVAATETIEENSRIGVDIVGRFETAMQDGTTYSERLDAGRDALRTTSSLLPIATPISAFGVIDDIRVRHDEIIERIAESSIEITPMLDDLSGAIAGGDDYLLLVSSTSEPRGASGGYYMVGTLGFDEQGPRLGALRGITSGSPLTDELVSFVEPGATPLPEQFASTYGGFGAGSDWTSLALSPRFDVTADVATRMWEAAGGERVRGAILIDPVALEHLLRLTGPVTIVGEDGQDRQVDAGNVVIYLDDGQYRGAFGDPAQRVARQGMLRDTVSTVIQELRDSAPEPLWFNEMSDAIRDRHLLMWFADPEVQAANLTTQIAGAFDGRSVSVTVSPMSGKYAPMLDVGVAATVACAEGTDRYELVVSTTFAPDVALHNYLAGSTLVGSDDPETMYGLVQLVVPRFADVDLPAGAAPAISGDDGSSFALAEWIRVPLGGSVEQRFTFSVPSGTELAVEPTGGSNAVSWTLGSDAWDASEARHALPPDACG